MNPLKSIYRWFEWPPRLLAVRPKLSAPGARILDVGCGNHSPSITKRYFPGCVYHGIDSGGWNLDARDEAAMDKFFQVDLEEPNGLDAVENATYDAVICSHLLEHLADPYAVVEKLARKLKPGGLMYIEVPAQKSLNLPKAVDGYGPIKGCLNFWDDPTHKTMVELDKVVDILEKSGCSVQRPRPRRMARRIALLPLYMIAGMILRGYIPTSVVWDVTGFAQWILVERGQDSGVESVRAADAVEAR